MLQKLKDRLVDDWCHAWRWFSVQLHAFATSVLLLLQLAPVLPPEVQKAIPQPWGVILTAVWAALGLYARLVKQKKPDA
jgi:hypothetical protein